ncbi:MAG: hypothetical protein U1F77_00795 [Kiritimatiellia bacterium]
MKIISLALCLVAATCSSCISGRMKKVSDDPLTFRKHMAVGFYTYKFDYVDGDLPGKPVVSCYPPENSKLERKGQVIVKLNGTTVQDREYSNFEIGGNSRHPDWTLTWGGIEEDGNVEIIISGEVRELIRSRRVHYLKCLK